MRVKEKLERANWTIRETYARFEIYGRGDVRILYKPESDEVYASYSLLRGGLSYPNEVQLEIFFEKEV